MRDLTDRVVLLTGAAGGIGSAVARELAERGARLALVDRDAKRLQAVADTVLGTPSVHVADLSDRSRMSLLVEDVVARFGEMSILIASAGCTVHSPFAELTPDEIDTVLEVDLSSVLHLVSLCLPHLRAAPEAHVVLVSSMAGFQAFPFQSVYSAAKFGLRGFGDALRIELHAHGIGVSTIFPGTTATGFLSRAGGRDDTIKQLSSLMLRFGTSPERVGRAIRRSIASNRGRVRVGWDSHLVGLLSWLAPPLLPLILRHTYRKRVVDT